MHRELRSLAPHATDRFTGLLTGTWGRAMRPLPDGEVFVLTGDIPAMWLRDSTAQVRPYLLAADDPAVAAALTGVLRRQLRYVLADPYANAFNAEPDGSGAGYVDEPAPRWSGSRSTRSTRFAPRSSWPTASGGPPAASAISPPTTASSAPPAASSPCGGSSRTTRTAHRTSSGASATTRSTRCRAAAGARRSRPPA